MPLVSLSKPRTMAACLLTWAALILGSNPIAAQTPDSGLQFRLISHVGRVITQDDLRGKPSIVFFGYTRCPDICPTQLMETSRLLDSLGPDAARINVYFVSLNPEHDTKERLARYLTNFHPMIVGLTGDFDQIAAFADALGAKFNRNSSGLEVESVDHSIMTYVIDSHLNLYGHMLIGHGAKIARTIASIRKMLARTAPAILQEGFLPSAAAN